MSRGRQFTIAAGVLLGSLVLFAGLLATKPQAKRDPIQRKPPFVTVVMAQQQDYRVHMRAPGRVQPAAVLEMTSQVHGRVVKRHPNLVPGGRVSAGDVLIQIDRQDYELAIKQRQADVAKAELALWQEQAKGQAAKRDYARGGALPPLLTKTSGRIETPKEAQDVEGNSSQQKGALPHTPSVHANPALKHAKELALRVPHLHHAKAMLAAAQSNLQRARLQLERTQLCAPFDAVVQSANVQVGANITPQAKLARLVASDRFWVKTSVPVSKLGLVKLPHHGKGGSFARLWHASWSHKPPKQQQWQGEIVHLMSDVEKLGHMAQLLVQVRDPLGLKKSAGEQQVLPLLVGAQVEVELTGVTLKNAAVLPSGALQGGNALWVVDESDRLHRREVQVLWRDQQGRVVVEGLQVGERFVSSILQAPQEGMQVRVANPDKQKKRVKKTDAHKEPKSGL